MRGQLFKDVHVVMGFFWFFLLPNNPLKLDNPVNIFLINPNITFYCS